MPKYIGVSLLKHWSANARSYGENTFDMCLIEHGGAMKTERKNFTALIVWIVLLILIGSGFGLLTKGSVDTWYQTLSRSPLTPPDYVFGIVWTILYTMIAASGWLIWNLKKVSGLATIKILYMIQLLLNWSWTPLFFYYHLTGSALVCLSVIIIMVTVIVAKLFRKSRIAALLLVPYLTWLLLAAQLNFYIWAHN